MGNCTGHLSVTSQVKKQDAELDGLNTTTYNYVPEGGIYSCLNRFSMRPDLSLSGKLK